MSGLRELVEEVRQIPYGRTSERTGAAVLAEGRGTCSTKHLLLQERAWEHAPEADVRLVHRVYRVTPDDAAQLFGDGADAVLPEGGLVDVHTYATALVRGRLVRLDVTFPGASPWDGSSDMPLACGPGVDFDAGDKPFATKDALVAEHCDVTAREAFIAALGRRP